MKHQHKWVRVNSYDSPGRTVYRCHCGLEKQLILDTWTYYDQGQLVRLVRERK